MSNYLTGMLRFVTEAGPFIWLQFLLAWIIVILALVDAIMLAVGRGRLVARLRTPIDAVLFWGCLTAVFGFLGQWNGLHRASKAVIDLGVVNPQLVVLGIGESLNTTVFGMFVLVASVFLWFVLRAVQSWKMARWETVPDRPAG